MSETPGKRLNPRALSFWDLTLYAVAMTLSVRWIATAAAAGPAALPLWSAAMLGFMAPLVIATAELTTRFPGDGGVYVWTRDVLGPFSGFICGWLYWTCNLPFFSSVLYFIVNLIGLTGGSLTAPILASPVLFASIALAIAIAVAGLSLLGLGAGKWVSNFGGFAACAIALLMVVGGGVLAWRHGPATDFLHADYRPPLTADGAVLWATMVFAFGGPEAMAFLKDDVKGGTRQILKVLATVGVLLVFAYSLATAGMLSILTPGEISHLSGLPDAIKACLDRLGLPYLTPVALGMTALALLGGYMSWFGVAARLPFVVGVDAHLPKVFSIRDAKTGAPTASILLQTAVVAALVILSLAGESLKAAYDFLVSMTVLSYTLPFAYLFVVYWKVQKETLPAAGWDPPGGPSTARKIALVGLVVTISAILCTLVPSGDAKDKLAETLKLVLSSGILILIGAGAYALSHFRKS